MHNEMRGIALYRTEGHNETRNTSCRFSMTNRRLACQEQCGSSLVRGTGCTFPSQRKYSIQGTNLNGITKRSTCTMQLETFNGTQIQASIFCGTGNNLLLSWTIWRCQCRRPTILVHRRSLKLHKCNRTTTIKSCNTKRTTCFTTDITICRSIQGLTPSIKCKHSCLLEYLTCIRCQRQIDSHRERCYALPSR